LSKLIYLDIFMKIINYYNLNVEFKDIPEIVPNALVH